MKKLIKKSLLGLICVALTAALFGCSGETNTDNQNDSQKEQSVQAENTDTSPLNGDKKPATQHTARINAEVYNQLDFDDKTEYECATRGLIDAPEALEIKDENGKVVWSQKAYAFLEDYDKAPDSVNPSLWENTKNNNVYGLFEVMEGVYQVRGYDLSNLTLVEGDTGWIVFDPMMSYECTLAAMELVEKNLGKKPIKAVIISHSHADHYGGIKGVISNDDVADSSLPLAEQTASGKVPVIVPEEFTYHAVSENVLAGRAMGRRANYQYGVFLEPGELGAMAMGIGLKQSLGLVDFVLPTHEVKETGEVIIIDGVEMEFQMTPGTEAPAEMNTWFPQKNALWMAENCTGTLHNLYTLRGAQVRDGNAWAQYVLEAVSLYGDKVEVVFQSHNWPHWGNEAVNSYMEGTAAVYKYINDQTLTYINQGYTSDEISNMIELPAELAKNWYTRQYYGTVAHNSKAVYQKYMGWYDANPVNLDPLSPSDSAKKWVEYLGDTDKVIEKARADFEKGEYRWVAEITNVLIFADPENRDARYLCADALEQLGYQAESGTWRNAYLSAAQELRYPDSSDNETKAKYSSEAQMNMPSDMMLDYMSIVMDKQKMADYDFTVRINLTDTKESYFVHFKAGVMLAYKNRPDAADMTLTCPKNALFLVLNRSYERVEQVVKAEGDTSYLKLIMDNMTAIDVSNPSQFKIVEP